MAPSWSPIHYVQTPTYWEPSPSSYSPSSVIVQDSVPGDMSTHESLYLSPEYSPPYEYSPTHSHDIHDPNLYNGRARTSPPPFNYTSSSLHSALSIPVESPSSSYLSTPTSDRPPDLCNSVSSSPEHPASAPQSASVEPPFASEAVSEAHQDAHQVSLGCTDIAVPVPFPDPSQEAIDKQRSATPGLSTLHTDTESYPTPVPSPDAEEVPNHSSDTSNAPERDPLRHYRTAAEKRKAAVTKPPRRKANEEGPPPRLSASLPVNSK